MTFEILYHPFMLILSSPQKKRIILIDTSFAWQNVKNDILWYALFLYV